MEKDQEPHKQRHSGHLPAGPRSDHDDESAETLCTRQKGKIFIATAA
jgi:hypothetical protein